MNKTKEEVIKHLQEVGYKRMHGWMIMAYLNGKGIIDINETLSVESGEHCFCDFVDWFEDSDCKNYDDKDDIHTMITLIDDITAMAEFCTNCEQVDRHIKQIDFLAKVAEVMGYVIPNDIDEED